MGISDAILYNRSDIIPLTRRTTPITESRQYKDEISSLKSKIGTLEKKLESKTVGWVCPRCNLVHSPIVTSCVCLTDLKLL